MDNFANSTSPVFYSKFESNNTLAQVNAQRKNRALRFISWVIDGCSMTREGGGWTW